MADGEDCVTCICGLFCGCFLSGCQQWCNTYKPGGGGVCTNVRCCKDSQLSAPSIARDGAGQCCAGATTQGYLTCHVVRILVKCNCTFAVVCVCVRSSSPASTWVRHRCIAARRYTDCICGR
ncbi:hypothetical protein BV25DRAFT_1340406 [Artomyces pyxidatus]|uniref:Uncharacterized protein n=1 Tax=Artomyces pyxidatus TaxID=48021 RepID=A0ACB8SPA7_9AGAM|nr:hypothetical protein BV25DRAFT_1340406 [Artomyces pyxidatus]